MTQEQQQRPSPRPSRTRRVLRCLLWTLAGAAALVFVLFLGLQTGPGKRLVCGLAENGVAAAPGLSARVEGLTGFLPFSLSLETLALSDAEGVWLVVKDFRFAWSPAALFRGRIEITELSAATIRVLRPPKLPAATEPEAQEPTPLAWPPRIPWLPPMLLDHLALGRVILDEPVAGQRAEIGLTGRLSEADGAVGASLAVRRLDGPKAFLDLAGALSYRDWTLQAALAAEEAPGGLVGPLLDPGAAGPLRLEFTGRGSLADWKGRLTAEQSGQALLGADVTLAAPFEERARAIVGLAAEVRPPAGMLPPEVAAVLGGKIDLALRAGTVLGGQALFLDDLAVTAGPARLTASGESDPEVGKLRFDLALDAPDLRGLAPLAGEIAGAVSVKLALSGEPKRPKGRLTLTAKDLAASGSAVGKAALAFDFAPDGDMDGTFPGLSLTGGGEVSGLRGPSGELFAGKPAALRLAAGLDAHMGVALRSLTIAAGGADVELAGRLPKDGELAASCKARVPDLMALLGGFGLPLTGGLRADVTIAGRPEQSDVRVSLSGGLDGLGAASGAPGAENAALIAALLGRSPTFAAKASLAGQQAELSSFALTGEKLRLAAEGTADLAAGTLGAKTEVAVPDLSALSKALGRPLAGTVTVAAEASGRLASPDAKAVIRLDGVEAEGRRISKGEISVTARDVAGAARGRLEAGLTVNGEAARLATDLAMDPGRAEVSGLSFSLGGFSLAGKVALDLASGLASGEIKGGAEDLSRLGTTLGVPLGGALSLSARFAGQGGGQDLAATVSGKGLDLPGAGVGSLSLTADVKDALRSPRGRLDLAVREVKAEGASVSRLELKGTGDGKGFDFTLASQASADAVGPASCDLAGRIAPDSGGLSLELSRLSAKAADLPLALGRKARIDLGPDRLALSGLDLSLGKAKITAEGGFTPEKADLSVHLKELSLADLKSLGLPPLAGKIGAEAKLSGSGRKPELALRLTGAGLGPAGPDNAKLPQLGLAVTAGVGASGLDAKITASGLGKAPLTVTARVPSRFSLAPFAFELPETAPLSGAVTAALDLKELGPFLERVNSRASGTFTADFSLSGALAEPVVAGKAGLANGVFENADAGASLKDMNLNLQAEGKRLRLEFSAKDAGSGSMKLSGEADLSPGELFAVDMTAAFKKMTVVNMDLAKATLDGEVAAKGQGAKLAATGKLFVGPAAVNIPSRLPPEVAQVKVVEVNNPAAPPPVKKSKGVSPASEISLDLTVGVGDGVYVRGMGVESEWEGELAISGSAAAPRVVGSIKTLQGGGVEFFGRRLELVRGLITFTGATPPNPSLDVKTSIATSDATCGVLVTGEATKPKIELTSEPSLPRDEILARILFGQSAGTITTFQALQLAQAGASLLSGGGSSLDLLSRTRRLAGLDELDFVPGQGGLESTKLRAGKYLTKGVKVSVDQGVTADSGAVSVEVDITPNISLESRVGADSKQGVGVNWKWDY